MALGGSGPRAEQVGGRGLRRGDTALHPHLIDLIAPACEQADAVAAGEDRVEMLSERVPRQPLEHPLTDLVGRLDVECHARHDSGRAEPDDESIEAGVVTAGGDHVAARGDELQPADLGRQVAVRVARPVRRRGDRAADGDVRQRGQVAQRDALARQRRRERPVRDRGAERDGAGPVVHDHDRGEPLERHELRGVRDVAERVARAEHPDLRGAGDDPPQLVERRRPVQPPGAVGVVAAPVTHAAPRSERLRRRGPLARRPGR